VEHHCHDVLGWFVACLDIQRLYAYAQGYLSLLAEAPNLQHLIIQGGLQDRVLPPAAVEAFGAVKWPKLRSFVISHASIPMPTQDIITMVGLWQGVAWGVPISCQARWDLVASAMSFA
jgi:hypothetical protein